MLSLTVHNHQRAWNDADQCMELTNAAHRMIIVLMRQVSQKNGIIAKNIIINKTQDTHVHTKADILGKIYFSSLSNSWGPIAYHKQLNNLRGHSVIQALFFYDMNKSMSM